jgi:hypothetical protein
MSLSQRSDTSESHATALSSEQAVWKCPCTVCYGTRARGPRAVDGPSPSSRRLEPAGRPRRLRFCRMPVYGRPTLVVRRS